MYYHQRGDCVVLGLFRFIVKEVRDDIAYVTSINDINNKNGKWILLSLLPLPIARIDLDKLNQSNNFKESEI